MFTCKLKSSTQFQGREALETLKSIGSISKKKVCLTLDDKLVQCIFSSDGSGTRNTVGQKI